MGNEMNTKREYDENVYSISKTEFQEQAELYLGRQMNSHELLNAMSLLSMCMTETIEYTYSTVFESLMKKELKRVKLK